MEQTAGATSTAPADVLGPRMAADVVAVVREGSGIRLDYSPSSLVLIDRIIDGIRHEHPPADAIAPTLAGFGAYAGEVLCRDAGAEWLDFTTEQRDIFGRPFGIRSADGRVWNPLDKAIKRYENGTGDSLHRFYLAVVGWTRV
ncbi:MAG: hypothetical protein HOY76_48910 [Streptomyces sp.]|nr:hypothetical protein [Streptomyces sp.]